MRFSGVFPAVVLMGFGLPSAVQAQKGGITGVMTNSWDFAAVTDASITLARNETTVTATPDPTGEFRLAEVTPGVYELTVSATGFRPYVRHEFRVGEGSLRMAILLDPTAKPSTKQLEADAAAKPSDSLAHFRLGRAYFLGGEMGKARQEEERALALQPESLPVLLGLAQLSLRQGSGQGGLKYTEQALRLKPDNVSARMFLAAAFLRLGRFDDSRVLLTGITKDNPNDVEALLDLGVLDLVEKKYDDAEEPFRHAYTCDPENLRGLLGMVEIHVKKNEPDKAVEVIAQEAQKRPARRELQKEFANALVRAGQYEKAVAIYLAVVDKYADAPNEQAEILTRTGGAYATLHDLPRAIEATKKATQLSPTNALYQVQLAGLYEQAGKAPEAMATYREAIKDDPDNAMALNNYAYILSNSGGDLQEALRLAQRARSVQPDLNEVLDTVGWIYLKMKMTESAARMFEDLTDRFAGNATFHYHFALALAEKGDKERALKQLSLALENKPNKADEALIRELIQKLS
jgi:tetratricopeptide (TPR) repeat protein